MRNKVRHNHIDGRTVEVVQLSTHTYHNIHERYNDLYFDYVAQQRNVYIKPKRALRSWRKASSDKLGNGPVRTLRPATVRVRSSDYKLLKELGL